MIESSPVVLGLGENKTVSHKGVSELHI